MADFFAGKVYIVTGSSRGIGRKTAALLLQAGARVVLNGRDPVKLEQARAELSQLAGLVAQPVAVAGDVTDPATAQGLCAATLAHFGRIDGLINNAGTSMRGAFDDLTPETVESIIRTNLQGAIYPTLAVGAELKKNRGSLVFVSSLAGVRGFPGVSIYSAAKMALQGLAQSLRAEWAGHGIHVGLVYLGFTENDPEKTILTADGRAVHHQRQAQLTQAEAATAVLQNLRKRRKTSILTLAGKFLVFIQACLPGLADWVVNRSAGKLHSIKEK